MDDLQPLLGDEKESESLDDVREMFKLGLCKFKAAPNHTTSDSTRKPQYYDRHLDKDLRPKKLIYCPELIVKLAEVANDHLNDYKMGTPSKLQGSSARHMAHTLTKAKTVVREEGIVDTYAALVSEPILPIVSSLAFKSSHVHMECLHGHHQK